MIIKKKLKLSFFLIFLILIGSFFAFISFFIYNYKIPLKKNLNNNIYYIFDINGNCFKNIENDYCYLKELNSNIINAFISAEDSTFFDHRGISLKGIIRSIFINIKNLKFSQGASTITQQYIKLSDGNLKKTLIRKIKEQIKAILIETHYSKEEILQEYLNILYFGNGIYGIKKAAKEFWRSDLKDLSISQSAALAGIIQSPERFNPFKNTDLCLKRRNIILKRMLNNKYINEKEYNLALNEDLKINPNYDLNEKNFLVNLIENFFEKNLKDKDKKKYYIQSTFDFDLQKICFIEFKKVLNNLRNKVFNLEGALILIENSTGEIRACINGFSPDKNKIRAFDMNRQVGSIIKPLIAYYAFLNKDTPESIYSDTPIDEIKNWNPRNNNRIFSGDMSIRRAIVESNNIVPIRILIKYGVENFNNIIKNTNLIRSPGPYYSLALGCCESTVLEMAMIINSINTNGKIKNSFFISKIRDESQNLIFKNKENNLIDLFDSENINIVNNILKDSAKRICKKLNKKYIEGLIAKTGTTNDSRTCWFIASNNKYSIALYLGTDYENNLSKYKISSLRHSAEIGLNILLKI